MSTRMTLFKAILVQDSALSVTGLDRDNSSDHPFTVVDGVPLLVGRGLKGAAVAMARRYFDPLPRSVSEVPALKASLQRSAWEFAHARPVLSKPVDLRPGVGILQETGARAEGILYDHEVVPVDTEWNVEFRVNWRYAGTDADEVEGILGYVLAKHWQQGRCWIGGNVARGMGWCHLKDLQAYRLDEPALEQWLLSQHRDLPPPESTVPTVEPTRSWCFRTLELKLYFGEYLPPKADSPWGVDMLSVGTHDTERHRQPTGDGHWARPALTARHVLTPPWLDTDRSMAMSAGKPMVAGSGLRGPMRHALSRILRAQNTPVQDPHTVHGDVADDDAVGSVFGTVNKSSRVLIRDAYVTGDWYAARLHMHAEDEFSAGSFESAKRDGVRLLRGSLVTQIVIDGPDITTVQPLVDDINCLVSLGAIGHLPIGGHKTRGAGWGRWESGVWTVTDVIATRTALPPDPKTEHAALQITANQTMRVWAPTPPPRDTYLNVTGGKLDITKPTLNDLWVVAEAELNSTRLVAWWCEPSIDFTATRGPQIFGRSKPEADNSPQVDEAAFFTASSVWRAALTVRGWRKVMIAEAPQDSTTRLARASYTPVRLHENTTRFANANLFHQSDIPLVICNWHAGDEMIGFTLIDGDTPHGT